MTLAMSTEASEALKAKSSFLINEVLILLIAIAAISMIIVYNWIMGLLMLAICGELVAHIK